MKTAYINSRLEVATKKDAEAVFRKLGLSPSDAIRLFYKQVALSHGLPFEVKIPNATTRAAIAELVNPRTRAKLPRFSSVESLLKDLRPKASSSKKKG